MATNKSTGKRGPSKKHTDARKRFGLVTATGRGKSADTIAAENAVSNWHGSNNSPAEYVIVHKAGRAAYVKKVKGTAAEGLPICVVDDAHARKVAGIAKMRAEAAKGIVLTVGDARIVCK